MPDLLFATNATASTKEITHGGRRYLVSPVVALREGVLNNIYVPAAEFGKFAASWAGRAVPIGHPKDDGGYISANSPDIWANDVPGHFWNVEMDGDKLRGEIWIDLAKAQAMGERAAKLVSRLRANQPVEVSTGYFSEIEMTAGTFNGAAYTGIARNIRPDHLALLPDELGACSWADGCGTPRVNSKGEVNMVDETGLFERFLGWFRQHKEINVNEAAPPCAEQIQQESEEMTKDSLIAGLVANAKCKFSKDKLQTWAEGDLQVLQDSIGAEEPTPAEPTPEVPHTIHRPETVPAGTPWVSPELDARIAAIESLLKGLSANSDREKAELVAAIVANAHGAWSQADLMHFDLAKLQGVYASYAPRDYSANAGYVRSSAGPEDEELLMVWPVYEKEGK